MPQQVIIDPSQLISVNIAAFIPSLISAIIIFVVGWIIAVLAGQLVTKLLEKFNVNQAAEKIGFIKAAKDGFNIAGFVGWLVEWFIIFIFLIAVADALQLPQISRFINEIANYIPNVIAASVIAILGIVAASAFSRIIEQTTSASEIIPASLLANLVKWAIIIFTVFAALVQLQIAPSIIQILFAGIVAVLVIALGLAFGLGGQEAAKKIVDKMSSKMQKK